MYLCGNISSIMYVLYSDISEHTYILYVHTPADTPADGARLSTGTTGSEQSPCWAIIGVLKLILRFLLLVFQASDGP